MVACLTVMQKSRFECGPSHPVESSVSSERQYSQTESPGSSIPEFSKDEMFVLDLCSSTLLPSSEICIPRDPLALPRSQLQHIHLQNGIIISKGEISDAGACCLAYCSAQQYISKWKYKSLIVNFILLESNMYFSMIYFIF